ncbi:MAG: hypothetical protein ACK5LT_05170 [Lachnospirales bacterium]
MKKLIGLINSKNNRVSYGLEQLKNILCTDAKVDYCEYDKSKKDCLYIYGGLTSDAFVKEMEESGLLVYHTNAPKNEGYYLAKIPGHNLILCLGKNYNGVLYGLLELCEIIKRGKSIPMELSISDEPIYKLRGPAVGIQLTKIEPPRLTYEYPVTPKRFPWFYDKKIWIEFFDQMMWNRCNVIYLWSGQPFSSFVKLKDFEDCLEVTEEEYKMNVEMLNWLTKECDKRGIWLVFKFYSIHIPLPLAEKNNIELLQNQITSLNRKYNYDGIVEFIKSFPNVGLMVCLGEALRGTQNKTDWFLDTVIPAVKEGVKETGIKDLPPLILRGHDCDPNAIMEKAVHMYDNLYTMWKYNGESLTSYHLTGKWKDIHEKLSSNGQTHIMNVHVLANLEPFRYAATEFIQKCIQAGTAKYGNNGLHLYPLFFWDWPYAADKSENRLLQKERDWMWYKAWFRYAWNPNLDVNTEKLYWIDVLSEHFNCEHSLGENIYKALNYIGECTPRMLRRFGITEGNRQTLNLGMTMSQLTNASKYRPNYELYKSVSTPGEQLDAYCRKEINGQEHFGENPIDMFNDVIWYAKEAYDNILKVKNKVNKNNEELNYYISDIEAIYKLVMHFNYKVKAAAQILYYKYTMDENCVGDVSILEKALPLWEESLKWYRELEELTKNTYLYANSMQTPQRKIPFPNGETYGHWSQCLPEYEKEFINFKKNLNNMKKGIFVEDEIVEEDTVVFTGSKFKLLSEDCYTYNLKKGTEIFNDMKSEIKTYAPELEGLTGIGFSLGKAITDGMTVKVELEEDSKILLAYMNAKGLEWLQVPDLETNTHADDRGGLAIVIGNAMQAEGCPDMNVHAFTYEKGVHELYLGTGGYTIVGIIPKNTEIKVRNAGLFGETKDKLDWLYE